MRTSDDTAKACLEALPGQLDRVDALLAEGVIGGERPNAADFQIAPSVRLMLCFDQLRDAHRRPSRAAVMLVALVPDYPGRFREVFPAVMASVLRQDVSSAGEIAAWLYHPEGATGAVVLGHGLSAVRDQRLPAYAERFAEAGLAALLFDYRHFGASGGEPRQLVDIDAPARGLAQRVRLRARAGGDRARRPVRLLVRRRAREPAQPKWQPRSKPTALRQPRDGSSPDWAPVTMSR